MAEKRTVMVLKADLQCPCCYKKIQKILCRIPQISDRFFDEKANTVIITVICCSPEKIRDKLLCKGGKIIKSVEIKEPPKPKDDKPKEATKPKDDKPKDTPKLIPAAEKPKEKEKPKETDKPKATEKPKTEEAAKPKSNGKGNAPPQAAVEKPKDAPKSDPPKNPAPAPAPAPAPVPVPAPAPAPGPGAVPVGLPPVYPANPCCGPCYEGFSGGPCYHGYGFPPPPPQPCYDSNYGPGYVYGRPCYVTKCDYFSEENSTGCTIM